MRNPQRNQLPDPIPSLQGFEGIINAKRSKAFGYGALTVGRNVEVTDEKVLLRRGGFSLEDSGPYWGLYGSKDQSELIVVRGDELVLFSPDLSETVLATGLLPGQYSWSEDPGNNAYFTSSSGSNGIVMEDGLFRPLFIPAPLILEIAAINVGTWQTTVFNLGQKYDTDAVHVFATYQLPDGRESAPSDVVMLRVRPEVTLLRAWIPPSGLGGKTLVYATAPGGSRYYMVASSDQPSFTIPVQFLNRRITGEEYPYTTSISPFPVEADLVEFYNGVLYAATYDEVAKIGVVYRSLPLQYHLFDPIKPEGFIGVSGKPLLLLACEKGLVIGTTDAVYMWDDEKLTQFAEYGVVPGVCGDLAPDGMVYFWTLRGVAKAAPYQLVTEGRFSGDPGVFNHARIFHEHGYRKLVASTVAGNASFNEWRSR